MAKDALAQQIAAWTKSYNEAVANNRRLNEKIAALDEGIKHAESARSKAELIRDTLANYQLPAEWAGQNADAHCYAMSSSGDISCNVQSLLRALEDYLDQLKSEKSQLASRVDKGAEFISTLASLLGF